MGGATTAVATPTAAATYPSSPLVVAAAVVRRRAVLCLRLLLVLLVLLLVLLLSDEVLCMLTSNATFLVVMAEGEDPPCCCCCLYLLDTLRAFPVGEDITFRAPPCLAAGGGEVDVLFPPKWMTGTLDDPLPKTRASGSCWLGSDEEEERYEERDSSVPPTWLPLPLLPPFC